MDLEELKDFYQKLKAKTICVVGDIILDEYIFGIVDRISPEAPVPVYKTLRNEKRLGGCGNVIKNLVISGAKVEIFSLTGKDESGKKIKELLKELNISTENIFENENAKTPHKTRFIASNQQLIRVDEEESFALDTITEEKFLQRIKKRIRNFNVIVVSDYGKGLLTEKFLNELIASAKSDNIPVVIDPKGNDFKKYSGATLITPNLKESAVATGRKLTDENDLKIAGLSLLKDLSLKGVLITRSEKGMTLFEEDSTITNIAAKAREVYDVTGAGDTVIAFVSMGIAIEFPLIKACQLANLAASLAVTKLGAVEIKPQELLSLKSKSGLLDFEKLVNTENLSNLSERLKKEGKKIVFTNGCFDLLHFGHISLLKKCREFGEILILGLNSDSSVRKAKGTKRPVINEVDRIKLLKELDLIDFIVLFDEETPLEIIKLIKPDILVKGGDYDPEKVVGFDFLRTYGGKVEIVKYEKGYSTSNIINLILNRFEKNQ